VLGEAIGQLLPSAAAVALSPVPIIAIVLVLDGPHARRSGPAFALGWVAGLTVVSVVVVLVAGTASEPDSDAATGVSWAMAAIGVAFLVMAAQQWRKRPRPGDEPAMPGWMASIRSVSAPRAVGIGTALSAANPKNLALTLAAAAAIANAELSGGDTALAIVAFVAIASTSVVGAVGWHLIAPRSAARPLAAIRTFMAANSAVIMMVILLLLGCKLLGDALSGVWS
jgi:threonine/homoserine/homoserine lactone efflux protein